MCMAVRNCQQFQRLPGQDSILSALVRAVILYNILDFTVSAKDRLGLLERSRGFGNLTDTPFGDIKDPATLAGFFGSAAVLCND